MDGNGAVTSDDGRWLPVIEAADLLRVSERSVRRYVRQGQLRSRIAGRLTEVWVSADGGGERHLPVADGDPDGVPSAEGAFGRVTDGLPAIDGAADGMPDRGAAGGPALAELVRLLYEEREERRLERERASKAEQAAAMWQERARHLDGEVGRLQELLALPPHEPEIGPDDDRPWWRRLFPGRKRPPPVETGH